MSQKGTYKFTEKGELQTYFGSKNFERRYYLGNYVWMGG
jgi:hypothetical protein